MTSRYNYLPNYKYTDVEGTDIILEKSAGKPLRDYKVYGNSEKNGQKTESVGDKTKNLFNVEKFVELVKKYDSGMAKEMIVDGRRCIRFRNYNLYHKDFSEVANFEDGKQYIWSMDIKFGGQLTEENPSIGSIFMGWIYDEEDYKSINIGSDVVSRGTIRYEKANYLEFNTVSNKPVSSYGKNVSQIAFSFGTGAYWLIDLDSIQIEEGTSATDYEPFGKYKIPIAVTSDNSSDVTNIFLDEPLRKIGESADYIDFKNQKLVQKVEVVNSSETATIEESFASLANLIIRPIELPLITTNKFTNSLEVCTTTKPSNIKIQYYKKG